MSKNNPVLFSELKIKMRGRKTALAVSLYIGIMIITAYLFFSIYGQQELYYGLTINKAYEIGLSTYITLAIVQFIMIIIITPALTASTISKEREMQTLDLLLCTPLSTMKIIFGKLISSLSFIMLLVFSTIPLFSLVFLFGGVTPINIIILFLFYMLTAFAIGSIGVFCSVLFKKSSTATVLTYIIIFTLGVITFVIGFYQKTMIDRNQGYQIAMEYVPFIWYFNPGVGFIDLILQNTSSYELESLFGTTDNSSLIFLIKNSLVLIASAVGLLILSAIKLRPVKKKK